MYFSSLMIVCAALLSSFAYGLDLNLGNGVEIRNIPVGGEGEIARDARENLIKKEKTGISGKNSFNKLRVDVDANIHLHLGDRIGVDLGKDKSSISVNTSLGVLTLSSGSGSVSDDSSVNVWARKVDSVVLDSAGDVDLEGVQQRDLEVILNGSGSIRITGHVENLVARISGSGDLELEDLVAENASIEISGAGGAKVHVKRVLNATISGAGDIQYKGNPAKVIPVISGAGSVEAL